jgi:hypothetical protein
VPQFGQSVIGPVLMIMPNDEPQCGQAKFDRMFPLNSSLGRLFPCASSFASWVGFLQA